MAKKNAIKVRITKPLWGKFKMPYKVGQDVEIESKLASELISGGFAISEADAAKVDKIEESDEGGQEEKADKKK